MLALAALVAQLGDRRRGVGQQAGAIVRIGPGAGDHARAIARADLVFIRLDDGVEGRGIHKALVHQQRFQRLHAQGEIAGRLLAVIGMVMVVRHDAAKSKARPDCLIRKS